MELRRNNGVREDIYYRHFPFYSYKWSERNWALEGRDKIKYQIGIETRIH